MNNKFNAAGLLLKFGESVLLGRRSSICTNLNGYWSMPCGVTEEGESPIDAAKREFFEETGSIAEGDIKFLNSFQMENGGEFSLFFTEADSLVFPSAKHEVINIFSVAPTDIFGNLIKHPFKPFFAEAIM